LSEKTSKTGRKTCFSRKRVFAFFSVFWRFFHVFFSWFSKNGGWKKVEVTKVQNRSKTVKNTLKWPFFDPFLTFFDVFWRSFGC
jgi:hypothetical protein